MSSENGTRVDIIAGAESADGGLEPLTYETARLYPDGDTAILRVERSDSDETEWADCADQYHHLRIHSSGRGVGEYEVINQSTGSMKDFQGSRTGSMQEELDLRVIDG
ncbi:MAG: hypothetical protein ABEN55_12985 [Bradymonadaceae bacterium]